jgi:hypothetical protein
VDERLMGQGDPLADVDRVVLATHVVGPARNGLPLMNRLERVDDDAVLDVGALGRRSVGLVT